MNSSKKGVSLLPMDLAAMQEQLNQLQQQLSQRMAQALGTQLVQPNSVTPVAGHQHSQNISSNQQLNSSTLNLMQEMLSSIQAQQGQQSSMTTPIRKPENVQQMLTILQHNPQLLQALITKTQSLTSEGKADPTKQVNFSPYIDTSLPPPLPNSFPYQQPMHRMSQPAVTTPYPHSNQWPGHIHRPPLHHVAPQFSTAHPAPVVDTTRPPPRFLETQSLPHEHLEHQNYGYGITKSRVENGDRYSRESKVSHSPDRHKRGEAQVRRSLSTDTETRQSGDRYRDAGRHHSRSQHWDDRSQSNDRGVGVRAGPKHNGRHYGDSGGHREDRGGHREDSGGHREDRGGHSGGGSGRWEGRGHRERDRRYGGDRSSPNRMSERFSHRSKDDDRGRHREREYRSNESNTWHESRSFGRNQEDSKTQGTNYPQQDRNRLAPNGGPLLSGNNVVRGNRSTSSDRFSNKPHAGRSWPAPANDQAVVRGDNSHSYYTNSFHSEPGDAGDGREGTRRSFYSPNRSNSAHSESRQRHHVSAQRYRQSQEFTSRTSPNTRRRPKADSSFGSPRHKSRRVEGDATKTSNRGKPEERTNSCGGLSSDEDESSERERAGRSSTDNNRLRVGSLYGTYDEAARKNVESTILPDYIESTPAAKYLVRNSETGNMEATQHLIDMEDKFEYEVVMRASRARQGRPVYKYPERTARLTCCKKDGCAHDSEDDSTDESDLEEGEVEDNSDEEEGIDKGEGQAEKQKPLVSQEVLAKLNHPERLHKFMCYNDKGETNYGPLCKCSRKARRIGVRHALYAGESLIEPCKVESNNIDRLYHYRLSLTPLSNFKVNNPTTISWDSRDYTFDGFSLFTHHKLQQEASFKTILYSSYYQIKLVEEPKPIMFTARSLNLIADYLFYELFEIADLTWVQEAFKHGCRQLHIMPRFTRPLPDNGLEILAIPHVLKYLLENSHPLIDDDKLEQVAAMEKPVWLEKVVKKYQFTLVTIPGMRPSTIRVDNMDRPVQDSHIVRYPQILHYSRINESLSVPDSKECRTLLKRRKKLHKVLNRRAISRADMQKYLTDLQSVQQKLQQLKAQGAGDGCSTKEPLIELSSQGFFSTGLRADVTQWSLIIPKIVDNVRFVQSLSILQDNMDYKFQNPFYLQLALTHPSYISCASLNQDHIRNTQTNCGLRKPEFGSYPVYKELRVKKKGLKTLLEIMSLKYRQYTGPIYSYERLEYLGDAVLEFLTTVHLYFTFPKLEEGGLATFRTALIRNEHLTQLSKLLGVQHYVLYAHGVDLCSSVQFDHTLANAFEAILGAVFLDGGLEAADKFLSKLLSKSLDFAEFSPCWDKLPPHPLQELYPSGDRKLIEGTPGLKRCTEFEELTGLRFNHISLLARALTHSSSGYTDFAQGNNQTLEFLGDSVLQLVVSDYLYKKYPNHHEGHLTLLRSSLVNNETQAEIFKDIGIAKFIYRKLTTEIQTKERADYVEALLGALFVDQGLLSCKAFCKALFFPRLKETIENQDWNDAKSLLQQCCLELRDLNSSGDPHLPVYKVVGQQGPTHKMLFKVAVYFKDQRIGVGEEKSIQKAQFEAAKNALDTNRSMFPMLLPGTNKLMTNVSSAQVRQLQRKLASRKKDAHALTHMESYWN